MKKTFEMLSDPVKIVRMEAARQLSAFPLGQLDSEKKKVLKKAFDEYEKVLLFTAERPESQLSLAMFYVSRKMPEKAEKAYVEAMRLQQQFVPAYINYSNFLVQQGENKKAFDHFANGNLKFDAQASAVALEKGVSADVAYKDGVAVFTNAIGGLMFEASIGGQHFSYKEKK